MPHPQLVSDDMYAPLPPSRRAPINLKSDRQEKSSKVQESPVSDVRHIIPPDRGVDGNQKQKSKSFKPTEIRGVRGAGHGGHPSSSDLSDSNTGSPISTIDSRRMRKSQEDSQSQHSRHDQQIHKVPSYPNTQHVSHSVSDTFGNDSSQVMNRLQGSGPTNGFHSSSGVNVEPMYENIPGRQRKSSKEPASRGKKSPKDRMHGQNYPKHRGRGHRYDYSSDEDNTRADYQHRSKYPGGAKHPVPTPRNRPSKSMDEIEKQSAGVYKADRGPKQCKNRQRASPRSQKLHNQSSQESDITFIDAEKTSEIELRLLTRGQNLSPSDPHGKGFGKKGSQAQRQRSRGGSSQSSRAHTPQESPSHIAHPLHYPSVGDSEALPAHLSSIEEGGHQRNGTVTMTGTIKRGTKIHDTVEVQYTLSRKELKSLNRSAKLEEGKKRGYCIMGLQKGIHIVLLSVLFIPFAFLASLFWSFYIGSLTWYNMFLYLSEEKPWYCRVFLCPWLIILYPVLIVLSCIVLAFVGAFKQLSWFLSSWYKEIRDPEKGFFGWLCEKLGVPQLAPYEVVVLDENAVQPQTAGQAQGHPQAV